MAVFNLFPEAVKVSIHDLENQLRQVEAKGTKVQPRLNNKPFFSHPAKRTASPTSNLSTNPYGFLQQARSHTTPKKIQKPKATNKNVVSLPTPK